MTDAVYGCDTCRTTIGRAGCPTHGHTWASSQPVVTHCPHGLDLRVHPRCYLCRPDPTGSFALGGNWPNLTRQHTALREAAQAVVDHAGGYHMGIECGDDLNGHLVALRAALRETP